MPTPTPNLINPNPKNNNNDTPCLVRLYLGRTFRPHNRSRSSTTNRPRSLLSPFPFHNMRNFPLCVDQMIHLGLDAPALTSTIAQTLALAHWHAGIDARDIEFVLGAPSSSLDRYSVPSLAELHEMEKNTDFSGRRPQGYEFNNLQRNSNNDDTNNNNNNNTAAAAAAAASRRQATHVVSGFQPVSPHHPRRSRRPDLRRCILSQ